jgi:hypothetical protein
VVSYAGIGGLLDDFQLEIRYLFRVCQTWAKDASALLDLNIWDDHVYLRFLWQANTSFQPYLALLYYTLISNDAHCAPPA